MSSYTNHRFKVPLVVMPVIIRDGKVLLGLRKNTGHMDGCFALPGGKHDGHESLKQAVAREVKEEVGITCHLDDIEFQSVIHVNNPYNDRSLSKSTSPDPRNNRTMKLFDEDDKGRFGSNEETLTEMAYMVFKVNKYKGEAINAEPNKCEKIEFFPIDQLPQNITNMSRLCIEHVIKNVTYDELGWEDS